MLEGYGYADLNLFQATEGWTRLSEEERSLLVAYLRRSETWTIDAFLTNVGNPAGVDANSLRPKPPQPQQPQPQPATPLLPAASTASNPMNYHNAVPVIIPPTSAELERLHAEWDKEWRREQKASSAGKPSKSADEVTLTQAERNQAVALGRSWSASHSGHGRASHGSYASSSSAYSAEQDRQRSEQDAIDREIAKALERKRKTGKAFNC